MRVIKKLAAALIMVAVVFGAVACKPKPKDPVVIGEDITPNSIVKLAAITNYGQESRYTSPSRITYASTTAEEAKLSARIEEKKVDAAKADASSIIKIFANSEANLIIDAMSRAALPADKMTKTVDYLAGEESVSEGMIQERVNTGTFAATTGWSFFDDWSYYEKLQDRADATNSTNNDADNVKRQYRNILGKVFAIGMSGDEFARVATYELVYATTVVQTMANGAELSIESTLSDFDEYCKNELDYETVVYLRAFNDYYNGGAGSGLADCVELYGYYYEYNRTNYNSQSDADFESQLKYSHLKVFTDAEWLDYVRIQRASYVNAYRYDDKFYDTFYNKHFSFQEKIEKHELTIYEMSRWQGKSYTEEMRQATRNNGIEGQMNFTDWLWCYAGSNETMTEYNKANTLYENGKNSSAEAEDAGKFAYEIEQLKMANYILKNMSATNLGRTLRFQVYSYSGDYVRSAQTYQKDSTLVIDGKVTPEDTIKLVDGLNDSEKINYATGKISVILTQMRDTYISAGVDSRANSAASQPWSSMQAEIQAALDYDYSGFSTSAEKVERLEDLVVKRKWSCGAAIDEDCKSDPNTPHVKCTKEYDEKHNISKFVMNYEPILRYMGGMVNISFQGHVDADNSKPNNYVIEVYSPNVPITLTAGYKGTLDGTNLTDALAFREIRAVSATAGETFADSIEGEDQKWWTAGGTAPVGSKPKKATSTRTETNQSNQQTSQYTYVYSFSGWYLDKNLKYKFDEGDKLKCDLILYVGYDVTKR